jgi:hypothetical protein
VVIVGAQNTVVSGNKLVDGHWYGLLTAGSINSKVNSNTVRSSAGTTLSGIQNAYLGLSMDDASPSQFMGNDVSGYFTAIRVQTDGADIQANILHNNCYGVFVDQDVTGPKISANIIGASNPSCPFAAGVSLGGPNAIVDKNVIKGQHVSLSGGIIVVLPSALLSGQGVLLFGPGTSGNTIKQNSFSGNDADVSGFVSGTGNVVKDNSCSSRQTSCNTINLLSPGKIITKKEERS